MFDPAVFLIQNQTFCLIFEKLFKILGNHLRKQFQDVFGIKTDTLTHCRILNKLINILFKSEILKDLGTLKIPMEKYKVKNFPKIINLKVYHRYIYTGIHLYQQLLLLMRHKFIGSFLQSYISTNFSKEQLDMTKAMGEGNESQIFSQEDHNKNLEEQSISDSNNCGHWSEEENLLYLIFLDTHKLRFKCRLKRKQVDIYKRKIKLFEKMAQFVGSRSSIQCRTHHQKYEHKFGDTKTILKTFKQLIGIQKYKQYLRELNQGQTIKKVHEKVFETEKKKEKDLNKKTRQFGIQTEEQDFKFLENLMEINKSTPQMNFNQYWMLILRDTS